MRVALRSLKVLVSLLFLASAISMAADIHVSEWRIETVDTSGAGRFTSLKIDRQGNVHVAYIPEIGSHPLRYAFWDQSVKKWFTMSVAPVASFSTLVLDSKQYPHISYADHGTGLGAKLRHAYWNGDSWKVVPIEVQAGAVVAYYTSIALDANDHPFFSFYDYADPTNTFRLRLRSVFWMGSYWQALTADGQGGSGKFNSIALDSKGRPHIAYANVKAETSGLRYASWDGNAWKTEIVDGVAGPTSVLSVSMVLDQNDNPHIAYTDSGRRSLKYATRSGGQWRIATLDSVLGPAYPDRDGITLDSEGNPYLSYYDERLGVLKVAFRSNGKWMIQVVDRNYAGFTSSVGIDRDTLWISYADDNEKSMKVAHRPLDHPVPAAPVQASESPIAKRGK
jgi:hypothetical protein